MKMGNPSDLSVPLLSSSDNVSSDATYIVSPLSDLPITDSELWLDSMSDSSKKHSMFNFYAVSVFSECSNQNVCLSHLIQNAERPPHPAH